MANDNINKLGLGMTSTQRIAQLERENAALLAELRHHRAKKARARKPKTKRPSQSAAEAVIDDPFWRSSADALRSYDTLPTREEPEVTIARLTLELKDVWLGHNNLHKSRDDAMKMLQAIWDIAHAECDRGSVHVGKAIQSIDQMFVDAGWVRAQRAENDS